MPTPLTDPTYRVFSDHLVALRLARDLTQRDVAARLGRPQSYVAKSERRERRLDPAEFRAIVLAMGADPVAEFAAVCEQLATTG
jgi:transcriptional regulator with XRE-family HTH domain